MKPGKSTKVLVDVANAGKRKGVDIVQMCIRDEVSSVTRPLMELKDFKKVKLETGENKAKPCA
jgi:beta-glucosidase